MRGSRPPEGLLVVASSDMLGEVTCESTSPQLVLSGSHCECVGGFGRPIVYGLFVRSSAVAESDDSLGVSSLIICNFRDFLKQLKKCLERRIGGVG